MMLELTPVSYLTLCGLVKDALQVPSDAAPILRALQKELLASEEEFRLLSQGRGKALDGFADEPDWAKTA
jgi:hypothetical protein